MGTVYIFGAGASFGAKSPTGETPPLASDLMKRGLDMALADDYEALWIYLKVAFGMNREELESQNIEVLLTQLESSAPGPAQQPADLVKTYGDTFFFTNPFDLLCSFIWDVVYLTSDWLKVTTCPLHDAFVSRLSAGDVVISFNYDVILDCSFIRSRIWRELPEGAPLLGEIAGGYSVLGRAFGFRQACRSFTESVHDWHG